MRLLQYAYLPEELRATDWQGQPLHLWRLHDLYEIPKNQCMHRIKRFRQPWWQEVSLSDQPPAWVLEDEYKGRFDPIYLGVTELVKLYKHDHFYGLELERQGVRLRVRILLTKEQEDLMATPQLIKDLYTTGEDGHDFFPYHDYADQGIELTRTVAYEFAEEMLPLKLELVIEQLREELEELKHEAKTSNGELDLLTERRRVSSRIGSYTKMLKRGMKEEWLRSCSDYIYHNK